MLTPQHKMQRMGLALQHLNRYHDEGHDMLARIVTGDESCSLLARREILPTPAFHYRFMDFQK
jgi:hypothetical protein